MPIVFGAATLASAAICLTALAAPASAAEILRVLDGDTYVIAAPWLPHFLLGQKAWATSFA